MNDLALVYAFLQAGEVDDAHEALRAYLHSTPTDQTALRLLAEMQLRLGQADAALATLDQLNETMPADLLTRSRAYERLGDMEAAWQAQAALIEQQPNERNTERGVLLAVRLARYGEAERLLTAMPTTWRWEQWRGDVAQAAGHPQAAALAYGRALQHLAALHAQSPLPDYGALATRLHGALADAYLQAGETDAARQTLEMAQALGLNDPLLGFTLAVLVGDLPSCATRYRQGRGLSAMMRAIVQQVRPHEAQAWLNAWEQQA